jgi:UDP-N-acetylmuramoyl-tripeptide--D-alanyl-D-alanine ligase
MKPEGIAILSGDDELLNKYDPKMKKITFGIEKHNEIRAENIRIKSVEAVEFDIFDDNRRYTIKIPAYGSHLAALAPAAAIIGRLLGLTVNDIRQGFMSYKPVEGRSNVTSLKDITLIDDCYNANPNSVKAALTSLSSLSGRRVAILGDMLNLGEHSEQMHKEIGIFAAQCNIDTLLCHGEQARFIYEGYISAGGKNARYYTQINEIIEDIPNQIKKDDVILVKASRGMYFEKLLPIISDLSEEEKII